MRKITVLFIILLFALSIFACSSMSRRDKGAIIGGTAGAVLGGVIGDKAGNTAVGAIIGAAVGGAAGAYIGNYMDNQAEEIDRDIEGARVERVGEGIKITFDSGILFNVNESSLQATAMQNLDKLAVILNKYEDTNILVEGHTDATGSEDYNMDLSLRRANSVGNYLTSAQVLPTRFTMQGYGETQPIASNETVEGRGLNRRVEVAIFANDKLKDAAERQSEG